MTAYLGQRCGLGTGRPHRFVSSTYTLALLLVCLPWIAGPDTARAGINVWTNQGPEGGNVSDIVIDPSSPTTLYVTTQLFGGVFKSTDGGASWRSVNNGLPTLPNVGALALDPSTPSILYAGAATGVFKSTDAGASWALLNSPIDGFVKALVVDPSAPATVYAGALGNGPFFDGGVFKSTDAGASWSAVNNGLSELAINALVLDPTHPATLYAGTSGGGVFKSTDGAASWGAVNSGLPAPCDIPSNGNPLAVDPSSPSTLYVTCGNDLYKSTDGGGSWAWAGNGLTALQGEPPEAVGVRPFRLVFDPVRPGTIYAATAIGMYTSTDGGGSWTAINNGLGVRPTAYTVAMDPSNSSILYTGTFGSGVCKSTDGGASWAPMNRGLVATNVNALATDRSQPGSVYAAMDNGVAASTDGGATWVTVHPSLSPYYRSIAVSASTPPAIYIGTGGGLGVLKSTDGGATWTALKTGLPRIPIPGFDVVQNVVAVLADPANPAIVYAATYGYDDSEPVLFKSTDAGASWSTASNGLANSLVFSLAVDPSVPATLYAGVAGLFKSTNGGGSWVDIGGPTGHISRSLAVDPSRSATLYVASSGGMYKSTDGGSSWARAGLDNIDAMAVVVDPVTPTTLYAGTWGGGVFKSLDGARTWMALNNGLRVPNVSALALDPGNPLKVYAGTYYGGVFVLEQSCGNGRVDGGEQCDDGNQIDGDGCDGNCTFTGCGNGVVTAGEQCDDGNRVDTDPCKTDCTLNVCGDGVLLNVHSVEQCDDGNQIDGDGCDRNCTFTGCGNGIVTADEECDDGNGADSDACKSDCTWNVCGDGAWNAAAEQCDDGNAVGGDGCAASCQSELAPGGGTGRSSCLQEWLTRPVSARNRAGVPMSRVRCTDDDPTCDAGAAAGDGVCTLPVQLWFNVADPRLPKCAPRPIVRVQLLSPSHASPRAGVDTANRDALEAAVVALGGAVRGQCRNRGAPRGRLCVSDRDCDSVPGNGSGRCRGRFVVFEPPYSAAGGATAFVGIQVRQGTSTRVRVKTTPANDPDTGRARPPDTSVLTLTCARPR